MDADESDPILWGRSKLAWTPNGYRLRIEMALDERASALFEDRAGEALHEFEEFASPRAAWQFDPGRVTRTVAKTEAEWAVLSILAPDLFEVDAEHLRVTLGELAKRCRREADEARAVDEERAPKWLASLNRKAS